MADTYLNKNGAQHRAEKTKEWADARFVRYTTYNAVGVAGNGKNVSVLSPHTLFVPDGLIMGGTALSAGLVTRGICGVTTPDGKGGCTKENLYLNYDGNNNYSRKVVLGAGSAGNEIANSSGAYTFSAVRGDQMVSYVTNYVPGAIKTWFDSNVHIPSIKTLDTNNSSAFPVSSSEAISGSGSINLHKVSKTGKFSDLSNRGEAFLSWGGQNFAGAYGPIDSAMIPDLGADRLAFMKPAGISVEYSRDSGTTWQDYGATDAQKLGLTSTGANFIIGKADSSNKATERYMLRISLHTSEGQVYTQLNKFAIYISTNGSNGSYCTIRARTQNNYLNNVDKWVVFANKQSISGWSGWNIINTSTITTYGNTASSQYGEIQFIFGCTSGSTSYVGLQILRLMGFGGVGWQTPSNMAKYGTIYSYDYEQNVKFPKKLYVNESKEVVTTGHTTSKSKTGISVSVSASKPTFTGTSHGHTITDNGHHHSYQKATSATFTGTAHGHTATDSGHTHKYSEVTSIELTNPVHTHVATDNGHTHSYQKTTGATFSGTAFNITHHTYSLDYNPNTYTLKLGLATSTSSVTPAGSITLKTENATTGSGRANVTLTKVAQNTEVSKIWMIEKESGTGKANVSVSNTTVGGSVSLGYTATDTGSSSTGITLANATAGGSVSTPTCTATVTDNGHTHTL